MLSNEEIQELLSKILDGCDSYRDEYDRIKAYKGECQEEIRDHYCDALLYNVSQGYTKYDIDHFDNNEPIQTFCKAVQLLPETYSYYYLLKAFFQREDNKVLSLLEKYLEDLFRGSQEVVQETGFFIRAESLIDYFF